MTEGDAVERTPEPITTERLEADLRDLGLSAGDTVLVHSSLSALAWVSGGAPAAVDALMGVVTAAGTLAMPTHSTQLSDPTHWENPPVPDEWEERIRETSPPFRPELTPTRGMGAIADCFRDYPGVVRSRHPTTSFAAWGADADVVVADHAYDSPLGERSPLARLDELDARVLRLGVDANTSLHLAEYRADYDKSFETNGGPVLEDGERRWVTFEEPESEDDFRDVEAAFEEDHEVRRGRVGEADATLLSQRELVEFGAKWMEENR
ncbi:AAC(3) family N-acetyltransferase [Haladaptatus sp. T7]|uniref:aminoglycoside N(3)-acetyltransferase n=1 Tax=Haladaptatus sp. T7 TaxID=2029368 RepID=UPI0021A25455|nr:AAC(3) family N-acetyltransferase [Haladaptatus sp. T7]GKZ13982.1 AAC(3) family N-acetyltransferase [Haladaptatus sp. T7]